MTIYQWKVSKKKEIQRKKIATSTLEHPLKNFVVTERLPRKLSHSKTSFDLIQPVSHDTTDSTNEILDPLTELALRDLDPLSRMQKENIGAKTDITEDEVDFTPIEMWNAKKTFILNKYTTSNKISVVSNSLLDSDKIIVKNQNLMVDKVQNRLEQLDWCEDTSQRRMELTQSEYVAKIDMLNKDLIAAWNSEQRVKAVKIAIQCAKLLADTDVMTFYPSKFVLITEILDIFGRFVYDRLKLMAENKSTSYKNSILKDNFTPDMISDTAKETCLNWFHKIASIRELVPRLYVELAIIRSYNFLSTTEASEALLRVTKMINGIGNPLVATYARCYLCRVGQTLNSSKVNNSYVLENLNRIIDTSHHLFNATVIAAMKKEEMSKPKYIDLFSPALDFIMEIIANNAPNHVLDNIFSQCLQKGQCSLILNTIISVFKPSYVANKTIEFLEMIGQSAKDGYPVSTLLCCLGAALGKYPPPSEQRKPILKNIGKYSAFFKELEEYMCYVEAWMPFIAKNFKIQKVNTMLSDVIRRVSARKSEDCYFNQLKSIMKIIVQNVEDFESLLIMDKFLPFLDLFQQDTAKVEICKMILSSCKNETKISDPVVISALSFLCTILHDSVDALTPEDELRQIGLIICNIVRQVDHGRDLEQQLNFYVEARGSFSNIDSVLIELVQKTNTLMMRTEGVKHVSWNSKSAYFVRACAAYCYITIPSISSCKARLELYLLSGQVALAHECFGQMDACFKAILNTIPEYKDDYGDEHFLVQYIKKFLSTILVVPDNPDSGVLSLLRSLLNVLQQYEWDTNGTSLTSIHLAVLDILSVMAQDTLPYHVDNVDSNDILYGGDEKFIQEINKICTIILSQILSRLKELGACRKQTFLAMDLFLCILNRGDLSEHSLLKLALNLWQQCSKHGGLDRKTLENIKRYYQSTAKKTNNNQIQIMFEKLA